MVHNLDACMSALKFASIPARQTVDVRPRRFAVARPGREPGGVFFTGPASGFQPAPTPASALVWWWANLQAFVTEAHCERTGHVLES
jgi:hypothetical protein